MSLTGIDSKIIAALANSAPPRLNQISSVQPIGSAPGPLNDSTSLASAVPPPAGLSNHHFVNPDTTVTLKASMEKPFNPDTAFIIKSFSREDHPEVTAAIIAACQAIGIKAKTVEENVGSGSIIEEILEEIQTAHFIICDLTDERPNVYYELGYADGVGNIKMNVLLVARHGSNDHFDVRHRRIKFYKNTSELREIIMKDLAAMREKLKTMLDPDRPNYWSFPGPPSAPENS